MMQTNPNAHNGNQFGCQTLLKCKIWTSYHIAACTFWRLTLRFFFFKRWPNTLLDEKFSFCPEIVKSSMKSPVSKIMEENKIIDLFSPGVCAELSPGAFRVSGRFHSRGRSQRVLLPQSPDLTCGSVILQCLRWQRSLTIYGKITFSL